MLKKFLHFFKINLDMKNIMKNLETDLGLTALSIITLVAFGCFLLMVKLLSLLFI